MPANPVPMTGRFSRPFVPNVGLTGGRHPQGILPADGHDLAVRWAHDTKERVRADAGVHPVAAVPGGVQRAVVGQCHDVCQVLDVHSAISMS